MGKVKKDINKVVSKPSALNKTNKISKGKSNTKKTIKEQIKKSLGLKDPKKSTLNTDRSKLADIVQNNTLIQVSKQSKKNKEGKPSKSAAKRKQIPDGVKDIPGKYVSLPKNVDVTPHSRLEVKFGINENTVKSAFYAVQKLLETEAKQHNKLFDDKQAIFLQINSVKVPRCPPRVARLHLKHSLFSNHDDICFIAVDIKNSELEEVKEHYEKLFADKGINNIKTILPYYQLRTEYEEYELKRRLVELYDVFLVDGRISGKVTRTLGKIFYQKRKLPVPIKFREQNLKETIQKALLRTALHIHPKGDSFIVQVCHAGMTEKQKIDNFWSVIQGLEKEFPGRWENVRSLHLKGSNTMAVPVYVNLVSKSEIKTPVIKRKRPKAFVPVSDELSTTLNRKVTVLPTGEVKTEAIEVVQSDGNRSEDEDSISSNKEEDKIEIKRKKKQKKNAENVDSNEESEVEYTQEELSYLQEMEETKKKVSKEKKKKQTKQKVVNKKQIVKQKGKKNFAKRKKQ